MFPAVVTEWVRAAGFGYFPLRQAGRGSDAPGDSVTTGVTAPDRTCEGGAALKHDPALPRIVVGADGSAAALAALRWAVREAGLRDTALHVVGAWEDAAKWVAPYASHAMAVRRGEDLRTARDRLRSDVTAALGPAPLVPVEVTMAEGLAARVLLDHAAGADLLVLGSALHRPPDGVGPVARACLRHAPCPVVVVSAAMSGIPVPA